MSFPQYPKYKPTGVDWLGDVPEHWEVIPLKHLAEFINGEAFKPVEWAESGFPIIRIQNLNGGEDFNYFEGEVEERYLVHDGDLLFGWSGNRGTSFGPFLWRRKEVCALNQHIFRVVPRQLDKHSLYWTLKAVTAHVEDQAHGIIGMVHVTKGDLGAINVPIAPNAEQTAIAEFLDRETAKIDGLMGEQRLLIELLKEKRQAVISHAVTRGLNPHAPLKPSGIEWLGDVPEHWEVRRISSLSTKITNGYVGPTRDILTGEGVRYLQSLHIKGNQIHFETPYFVGEIWSNQHSKSILEAGDVLIVQTGDIGQVAVVTDEYAGCNCHALIIVAPVRSVVDGDWMSWVLNADYGFHTLLSIQTGALHPHLNCGDVKDIAIPLPPIEEQRRIVEHVLQQVQEFDTLTAEAQRAINLLQERRSALISDAVTGKIDVRNV